MTWHFNSLKTKQTWKPHISQIPTFNFKKATFNRYGVVFVKMLFPPLQVFQKNPL